MSEDSGLERYAYTNPSAEQSEKQVTSSVDAGITCRVENLPRDLCAPESGGPVPDATMRKPQSPGSGEEGVRFFLEDDESIAIRPQSMSAPRMPRSTSSFASFDELFDGVDDFLYPLPPAYHHSHSVDNGFYSDDSPQMQEVEDVKREDSAHSRMSQSSLRQMIRESWESTTNYWSFHRRLGPYLNDKYCMRLQIHSTIFMFIHVVYGAAMLSMAAFSWTRLSGVDSIVGAYLLTNGILSVFLFPILLMEWAPRVGGCIEEKGQVQAQAAYYFALSLFLRICACVAGLVCVYYRYPVYFGPGADPEFEPHKWEFLFTVASVCLDWFIFFVVIVIPTCCFCSCYWCAGTKQFAPKKRKTLLPEKQEVTRE